MQTSSCKCIHSSKIGGTTIATEQGNCKIGVHLSSWRRLFLLMNLSLFAAAQKNRKSTIRVLTDFRKHSLLLKRCMSPFFFSKVWGYNAFKKGLPFLQNWIKYMLSLYENRSWCSKSMCNCIHIALEKIQIQTLTNRHQDCHEPDVFQNVMSKLVQDMEYVKTTILSQQFVNTNKYQLQRPFN
jgi:hypothetical protein